MQCEKETPLTVHSLQPVTNQPINQSNKFRIIALLKWNKYIVRISIAFIALLVLYVGKTHLQTVSVPAPSTQSQLTTGVLKTSAFEHSAGVQLQRPFSVQTSNRSNPDQLVYHHTKAIFSLCRYGFLQLYNGKIKAYIHFPERIFFCVYRL